MPEGLDGKREPKAKTVAARDGCVVDSQPLAREILLPFVDEWSRKRPTTAGQFARGGREETPSLTATGWLSAEAEVNERTIQGIIRRDRETGESKPIARTTELWIADRLATAVGRPEVFYDGTLEVRENPLADKAARARCCRAGGTSRF